MNEYSNACPLHIDIKLGMCGGHVTFIIVMSVHLSSSVNNGLYHRRESERGGLIQPGLCMFCKYTCFIFVASS